MHFYATKQLPFVSDEEAISTPWKITIIILAAFWVPLYREFHIYFAHRFIHIKALYKYIHSLHHHTTDIEYFLGLSMHPVEHVYHYSSVGPSLLMFASPFAFMWNVVHVIISPAAEQSGWKDHFQADQFHYLHHRYNNNSYNCLIILLKYFIRFFECNYGTAGVPFDKILRTFRNKLKETGISYKGGSEEKVDDRTAAIHDAKASITGLPEPSYAIYIILNCAIWALLWFALQKQYGVHEWNPHHFSFLASVGPVVIAQIMANITESSKRSIFYPFHKEGWKTISGHVIVSSLVCIGPVYVMVHMLLSNPGDSLYFWLRG